MTLVSRRGARTHRRVMRCPDYSCSPFRLPCSSTPSLWRSGHPQPIAKLRSSQRKPEHPKHEV